MKPLIMIGDGEIAEELLLGKELRTAVPDILLYGVLNILSKSLVVIVAQPLFTRLAEDHFLRWPL